MAKVVEMLNTSNVKVSVMLSNGVTAYVAPREKLENVDVANLAEVRKYFKVREPLNEKSEKSGK